MPLLIAILLIIAGAITLLIFSYRKKEHYRKEILPKQIKLVNELANDLRSCKVKIAVVSETKDNVVKSGPPKNLSLAEIGKCIDSNNDLALDKYDDFSVFIGERSRVINIPKYLFNRYMPDEIQNELRSFNTNDSEKINNPSLPCFILTEDGVIDEREYLKVNTEGYESWQQFKESAHSLDFVVKQWLKENAEMLENKQRQSLSLQGA